MMGKFKDDFQEPIRFSEGGYFIDGDLSRLEAAERFKDHIGEAVKPDSLTEDRVRFRLVWIDGELESMWWSGAGTGKGTQPVWVLD